MLGFLDDSLYVGIRKGIEFYYFGLGCIADYYSSTTAYLDEVDVSIAVKCDGNHRLCDIIQQMYSTDCVNKNEYLSRINNLYKKGILVFRNTIFTTKIIFHGAKGLYYPKEIAIELTNTCNYGCPFCYKEASKKGSFITDDIINKLNHIIYGNVNNILLTGGEPTLHPNLFQYIDMFSEYANVHMITNGSSLHNLDFRALRKLKVIQFSIYGCNNDEYAKMTGNPNGFTDLCKSIEFAKKNDIFVKGAVTLCDQTIDHIEAFIQVAIDLELNSLRIGIADIFGRGKYLYDIDSSFKAQQDRALDLIIKLKHKYRNILPIELPNISTQHVTSHEDISKHICRNSLQCGCGSEYLVISNTGEVRPCQMLPEAWFSIKDENALEEHVSGNFHIKELYEAVRKYYSDNKFDVLKIAPCEALETFADKERIYHV